ncbi:MAG: GMC family oxidoreductase [Acidimicrobiaceae bacterium]|nr:GMC family oxidoreductase [Acidimicrobiaceae bacterium]
MNQDSTVVVIGSGPSGAMAAHQLVREGARVIMLESGSSEPTGLLVRTAGRTIFRRTPQVRNERHYVASGHPSTTWYRELNLGGLSNQWTGAVPRFAPEDFSDGERLDVRYRWPLDYEDLAPFYVQAEHLLDVTSSGQDLPQLPAAQAGRRRTLPPDWMRVADIAALHGHSLTVLPLADGPDYLLARRATAFNSYSSIIRRLQASPRFTLRTGWTALRLEWSGARRRVESVICHDGQSGEQHRVSASAVVVACGPLGSTKLLFDSACQDFPEGLGNSEGLLGRYLHDHPKEWWSVELDKPITRLGRAAYLTRSSFDAAQPLTSTSWTIGLATDKEKVRSLLPGRTRALGVQVFGSMIPRAEFYVRPHATETDEFGFPQLEIHLDFDPDVIKNVHSARSVFTDLMGESGHACRLNPVVPQCVPGAAVHFGGTARMHRSRRFGVTDPWSRLFDASNVVVADASTFTTSSEKNPTLTAMALAARAADRLAYDLRRGP